jgi:hypothetical protein
MRSPTPVAEGQNFLALYHNSAKGLFTFIPSPLSCAKSFDSIREGVLGLFFFKRHQKKEEQQRTAAFVSGVYFAWSFFIFPSEPEGGFFRRNTAWTEKGLANATDCIFIMRRQNWSVGQSIIRGFIEEGLTIRVTAVSRDRKGEEDCATVAVVLTEQPTVLAHCESGASSWATLADTLEQGCQGP